MSENDLAQLSANHAANLENARPKASDYLICASGASDVEFEEFENHRPVGNRFADDSLPAEVDLGRGVVIKRLEHDLAERIMDACSLRGENFKPTRQFGQYYAFVRDETSQQRTFPDLTWDRGQAIAECMQLSRLIIDNASSYKYAARVIARDAGDFTIAPADIDRGNVIYRVRNTRDWMTVEEAIELRDLLTKFRSDRDAFPSRVSLAIWKTEYASSQPYAEAMVGELVSALESLLKIGRRKPTKQFRERLVPLAAELGLAGVSSEFADRMYEARSEWHHGAPVKLFAPGDHPDAASVAAVADVALLQDVTRASVRRAIEDEQFRAHFESDEAVAAKWPLSEKAKSQ